MLLVFNEMWSRGWGLSDAEISEKRETLAGVLREGFLEEVAILFL